MSADKACQTTMCLGGNSDPNPCPGLSSVNSDFMYLSDVAFSDCSDDMLPFPPVNETGESSLSNDSAACEALAECFEQKLAAANEKGSDCPSTGSLPSRFTVDSRSVS